MSNKVELIEFDAFGTFKVSIICSEEYTLSKLVSAIRMTEHTPVLRITDKTASLKMDIPLPP